MADKIAISVVIPTYNRKHSLLRLLRSLGQSSYAVYEVIIVDSGDEKLTHRELEEFNSLNIKLLPAEPSVCIQRNLGIREASSEWIFLCDDDLEIPEDYVFKIVCHILTHPEAGAVTGKVLQNNGKGNTWTGEYPLTSSMDLLARYIFQLSVWGPIEVSRSNILVRSIKRYYNQKGNHLTKAGWPVMTDFSGDYLRTPSYGLGASIVKKQWLIHSPYDEVLDSHGIGDNYGVAAGFPAEGIHVLNNVYVYHYRAPEHRLVRSNLYYRRILALDYFLRTKKELNHISRVWFIWSLIGNMIILISPKNLQMIKINLKLLSKIIFNNNPYVLGKKSGVKVVKPEL
jgi:glycosyltransferase involved in cell wall biosynthesis